MPIPPLELRNSIQTRNEDFVKDLAMGSYSSFIADRVNSVIECGNILKSVRDDEQVKKTDKIKLCKMISDIDLELAKLVSGDILKASASNWAQHVKQLEDEITRLKSINKTNE